MKTVKKEDSNRKRIRKTEKSNYILRREIEKVLEQMLFREESQPKTED